MIDSALSLTTPNEILMEIFSYLSPRELKVASAVNKHWKELSEDKFFTAPLIARSFERKLNKDEVAYLVLLLILKKDHSSVYRLSCLCSILKTKHQLKEWTKLISAYGTLLSHRPKEGVKLIKKVKLICPSDVANKCPYVSFLFKLKEEIEICDNGIFYKHWHDISHVARESFLKEFENGVVDAGYFYALENSEDHREEWLLKAAEKGSAPACRSLAIRNEKNNELYLKYLTMGAEAGDSYCMAFLAGAIGTADYKNCVHWIGKAAVLEFPLAQIWLGRYIAIEIEGAKEYEEEMILKSIDTVHVEHGKIFWNHIQNIGRENKEVRKYRESQTQEEAFGKLALIYLNGKSIEKDLKKVQEFGEKSNDELQQSIKEQWPEFQLSNPSSPLLKIRGFNFQV